jgi:hypothetical protein
MSSIPGRSSTSGPSTLGLPSTGVNPRWTAKQLEARRLTSGPPNPNSEAGHPAQDKEAVSHIVNDVSERSRRPSASDGHPLRPACVSTSRSGSRQKATVSGFVLVSVTRPDLRAFLP